MDTITLLCNLQAEGPASLRRLRAHGVRTLSELLELPLTRLAAALDADPGAAARFQREARALVDRCGEEELEPETPDANWTLHPPAPLPEAEAVDLHESQLLTRVSEDNARVSEGNARASKESARIVEDSSRVEEDSARVVRDAARVERNSAQVEQERLRERRLRGNALRPGLVPRLDSAWCEALEAVGVQTLEALWTSSAFDLSRKLDRPLTEVIDLQCEAQRHLRTQPEAAPQRPRNPDYTVVPVRAPEPRSAAAPAPPGKSHRVGYPAEYAPQEDRSAPEVSDAGGPFA